MKKLLVVVDMQNDFIGGPLGTKEVEAVVPAVAARIKRAKADGDEILFTRDTHGDDYPASAEGKKLPVAHCLRGTYGWQIDGRLDADGAIILDKPAFGSVALGEYVRSGGYGEIELVGVCTDICVISNALLVKAFSPETRVAVRRDCCAGVTPESHENALRAMAVCQIEII